MGVVHGSDLVCFVYQPWEVNDIQCLPYVSTSNLRMLTILPSDNTVYIRIPTGTGTEPGTACSLCPCKSN